MSTHRRRASDLPFYRQAFMWLLAPFVDHWRGLSLTRLLAFAVTGLVVYIGVETLNLSWVGFWMVLAAISAAFGKGEQGWGAFLGRIRLGTPGTETRERTETTTERTTVDVAVPETPSGDGAVG